MQSRKIKAPSSLHPKKPEKMGGGLKEGGKKENASSHANYKGTKTPSRRQETLSTSKKKNNEVCLEDVGREEEVSKDREGSHSIGVVEW